MGTSFSSDQALTSSAIPTAIPEINNTGIVNAIILEDEPSNMELLTNYLGTYCSNVNITGTGDSVADGVKLINNPAVKIDVAFLDIRLVDGLAFDIFKYLNEVTFDVIFVTAYDEYFKQACGFYSIGYILKPLDAKELVEAVSKVRSRVGSDDIKSLEELMKLTKDANIPKRFSVPTSKGYSFVEFDDIIRLEGYDNYTKIITKKETLLTARTLKVFEKLLVPYSFYRIHKQHIVNLQNMKQYLKTESYVEMVDGLKLPVSKRRKAGFLKILKSGPFT